MSHHNPAECLTCRTGPCTTCRAVFTRGGFTESATCPACLKQERDANTDRLVEAAYVRPGHAHPQ